MFWYEINGFLYVEKMFDIFSPAKMLEMSPGEWWIGWVGFRGLPENRKSHVAISSASKAPCF